MFRILGIVTVTFTLLALGAVYVERKLRRAFRLQGRGKLALRLSLAALVGATLLFRSISRHDTGTWISTLAVCTHALGLGLLLSVLALAATDIARATLGLRHWARRHAAKLARSARNANAAAPAIAAATSTPPEPSAASLAAPDGSRREFLLRTTTSIAVASGLGTAAYGAAFGRHDYQLETYAPPVPGLRRTLDGFTFAQLSDVHIGAFVREPELRAAIDLVRRARPDVVVLTGDLVDHDPRFLPMLGAFVRALRPLARHGVVAILGNHDYYTGATEVLATLERAGAITLRNAGRVIGDSSTGFALLGVDDVWAMRHPGGGPDLARALRHVPPDLPRILLCHNPAYFRTVTGKIALQLSGHTHGGQVNPAGIRVADYVLPYGYVAGEYVEGSSRLYVNRGFGTAGPPARVGAPPEVTKIVLVSS